jgi:hypothetical protein
MKILLSHPNIKDSGGLSKNASRYIAFLEEDAEFENNIIAGRIAANVPPDGFNIDLPIEYYNRTRSFSKIDYELLEYHVKILIALYGFPRSWFSVLMGIFLFNVVLPPDENVFPPIGVEINHSSIQITINENISITAIYKYLKSKNHELEEALEKLPKIPRVDMTTIKEKKKLQPMNKDKKSKINMTIAKELEKETNPSIAPDYSNVATHRARFRKAFERIIKKDYQQAFIATIVNGNSTSTPKEDK